MRALLFRINLRVSYNCAVKVVLLINFMVSNLIVSYLFRRQNLIYLSLLQITATFVLFSHLGMGLVDQDIPIPCLSCIHIHHRLVRILHRPLLNPRLHAFLHGQLQHLLYLVRRTNGAATDSAALCDEREGVESGQSIFGRPDLDEGAIGAEEHQILFERHIGRGDGADDEI